MDGNRVNQDSGDKFRVADNSPGADVTTGGAGMWDQLGHAGADRGPLGAPRMNRLNNVGAGDSGVQCLVFSKSIRKCRLMQRLFRKDSLTFA